MKRHLKTCISFSVTFLIGSLIALGTICMDGCKTATVPLPANAINSIDAATNTTLQVAYAFASTWTQAVLSTDPNVHVALTAAQLTILKNLNLALNVAVPLEQAYHASPTAANQAAVQAALPSVQSAYSAAQTSIGSSLPAGAAVVPTATTATTPLPLPLPATSTVAPGK